MKIDFLRISLTFIFTGLTTNAGALDCSADCPTEPIGVLAAPFGLAVVSPARVTADYTGCQVAWDEEGTRRIVLEFVSGALRRADISKVNSNLNLSCLYEGGQLTENSPPQCNDFGRESPLRGIDAMPVDRSKVDWPDGHCLPTIKFNEN